MQQLCSSPRTTPKGSWLARRNLQPERCTAVVPTPTGPPRFDGHEVYTARTEGERFLVPHGARISHCRAHASAIMPDLQILEQGTFGLLVCVLSTPTGSRTVVRACRCASPRVFHEVHRRSPNEPLPAPGTQHTKSVPRRRGAARQGPLWPGASPRAGPYSAAAAPPGVTYMITVSS